MSQNPPAGGKRREVLGEQKPSRCHGARYPCHVVASVATLSKELHGTAAEAAGCEENWKGD